MPLRSFFELEEDLNDETVRVVYKEKDYKAKVLEVDYNKERNVDYAILEIIGIRTFKYLETLTSSIKTGKPIRCRLSGFVEKLDPNIPSTFWPQIDNEPKFKNVVLLEYSEQTGVDLDGLSGAPVCFMANEKPFAIGIHSSQISFPYTKARAFSLVNFSNHYLFDAFDITETAIEDNKSVEIYQYKQEELKRFSVHLYSKDNKSQYLYYKEFNRDWRHQLDRIDKKIEQINRKKPTKRAVNLQHYLVRFNGGKSLYSQTQRINNSDFIRLIVDFSGTFQFKEKTGKNQSHLIGISMRNGNRTLKSNQFYDLIIEIDRNKDPITSVYNILEDIILDINFYRGSGLFSSLYRKAKDKKDLSRLKVKYINDLEKKPYGINTNDSKLRYLPFGSIIRNSLNDDLKLSGLQEQWSNFESYVINDPESKIGDLARYHGGVVKVNTRAEILEYLKHMPKLGGQIALKKLSRVINGLEIERHGLVFYTRINSRPKTKKEKDSINQIFRRSVKSNFRIGAERFILKLNEIPSIIKFKHHLIIIVFRITNP